MRVTLRPTLAADLVHVTDEPLPHRIKAITALIGERVIGVGGLGYRPDGTVIVFATITDEFRKYPVAVHRAGVAAMAMIRASGVPQVVAEAQPDNPAAVPWLLRFGFEPRDFVDHAGTPQTAYVWERAKQ